MDDPTKKRRTGRKFTPGFKASAVRLCRSGDGTIARVAKDLDLTETALRSWTKRAEIEAENDPPGTLTQAEREELPRIRKKRRRLQTERDILERAATFIAKERS